MKIFYLWQKVWLQNPSLDGSINFNSSSFSTAKANKIYNLNYNFINFFMQFILKILIKAEAFNIKHSSNEMKRNEWRERFAISIVSFICFSKEMFSSYHFYSPLPFMMIIIIIIMMRLPPTKKNAWKQKKRKSSFSEIINLFYANERFIYISKGKIMQEGEWMRKK